MRSSSLGFHTDQMAQSQEEGTCFSPGPLESLLQNVMPMHWHPLLFNMVTSKMAKHIPTDSFPGLVTPSASFEDFRMLDQLRK
jgi:hypothetical protein